MAVEFTNFENKMEGFGGGETHGHCNFVFGWPDVPHVVFVEEINILWDFFGGGNLVNILTAGENHSVGVPVGLELGEKTSN